MTYRRHHDHCDDAARPAALLSIILPNERRNSPRPPAWLRAPDSAEARHPPCDVPRPDQRAATRSPNPPVRLQLPLDVLVDDEVDHGLGDAEVGRRYALVEAPHTL